MRIITPSLQVSTARPELSQKPFKIPSMSICYPP